MGSKRGFSFYHTVDCPDTGSHTFMVTVEQIKGGLCQVRFCREFDDVEELTWKDTEYATESCVQEANRRIRASAARSKAFQIAT